MIRFVLGLLPSWAWLAAAGLALVTVVTWHLMQVNSARKEGRAEVYAKWEAEKAAALEAKAEGDRLRRQANQGVTDRAAQERNALAAAAAAARTERDGLLAELARRGDAGDPAAGPGADEAAATARALGECSGRYAEVAGVADALSAQVRGLQDYTRAVCLIQPVRKP